MKVGIITLHKVQNFGSALQAYALQEFLEKEGHCKVELIDYIYPNKFHKDRKRININLQSLRSWLGCIKDYLFKHIKRRQRKFNEFYDNYFHLSQVEYNSIEEIEINPPLYDLYITGSDQVWNYKYLKNDPVMYCSFAPEGSKIISFGASFTNKTLPEKYRKVVKERLDRYSKIGVREQSSLQILSSLGLSKHIKTTVTCDPTLLLNKNDYHKLALKSDISISEDFILVYGINYAYDPEPALSKTVDAVASKLDCKVLTLSIRHPKFHAKYREITGIGPCEFCYLFEHAKYIITSSFHGTMFSVINRKPFTSVVPNDNNGDRRIKDFLDKVGLTLNYVHAHNTNVIINENCYSTEIENNINNNIIESKSFLLSALTD